MALCEQFITHLSSFDKKSRGSVTVCANWLMNADSLEMYLGTPGLKSGDDETGDMNSGVLGGVFANGAGLCGVVWLTLPRVTCLASSVVSGPRLRISGTILPAHFKFILL